MRVRWLGWAGAEYEHDGETVVVDPLADPAATFAGFGAAAERRRAAAGGRAVSGRGGRAWSATCTETTPTRGALMAALAPGRRGPSPRAVG